MKIERNKQTSTRVIAGVIGVALCSLIGAAVAETFPARSISIIIPYSAGGSSDTVARALGQEIQKKSGQSVIVESRPGGNTVIGTNAMLERPADGYTVSIAAASSVIVPQLVENLPYDFHKDVAPVMRLYGNPHVLVVGASAPAKNLDEFISWVSKDKEHATYSSVGTGSSIHLGFERFKKRAGINMLQIPYKGSPAAVMAVLSGEVDATFADVGAVMPHIQTGKLRAIAVGGTQRSPSLPDVPTFDESGLSGFTSETWMGLITNAQVSKARIDELNALFSEALAQPSVQSVLLNQGVEAQSSSSDEFSEFIREEAARYKEIIEAENISLQ